ncbi:MAG TPA: acyltransferase [Planctomycetota bacterium]|nr:acyltransferase [Planctomycetota bacterium]
MFRTRRLVLKALWLCNAFAGLFYKCYLFFARGVDVSLLADLNVWQRRNLRLGRHVTVRRGCILDAPGGSAITLGDGVTIKENVHLLTYGGPGIAVGARTTVNSFCILYGHGGLTIGRDCLIAPMCVFIPANHVFDAPRVPISRQGVRCKGIRVGDNCWLGTKVTVLDGITIGDNCVIGAGAVVTHDIPPDSIAVGVPARVVKTRGEGIDHGGHGAHGGCTERKEDFPEFSPVTMR